MPLSEDLGLTSNFHENLEFQILMGTLNDVLYESHIVNSTPIKPIRIGGEQN